MEPQVKYARTDDGVNLAYYTLGSGPPFLWLSLPQTHLLEEWRVPQMRAQLEGAAQSFTVIRMDFRGFGLSDRQVPDINFERMADDIGTVMDRVTGERVAVRMADDVWTSMDQVPGEPVIVLAMALAIHPAVIYAAHHPDRVSRLVLLSGAPNLRIGRNARLDALYELAKIDWDFAAETITRSFWDLSDEQVAQMSGILKASTDPETLFELVSVTERDFDASETMKRLSMPTLVLHDRSNHNTSAEGARTAAALIPQGRFVEVDTAWHTAGAVARFLAETGAGVARPARTVPKGQESSPAGGMTAILFADIVDSTALTERLGDTAFREKARELDASLRSLIRDNGGTPIEGKLLGDGVLATFASAAKAIEAALTFGSLAEGAGLELHLGIHAGDVIREEGNVFGGAVNIAARISGLSAPGEVLVSETVRSLARTSAGVGFEDRGEQALKGVGEPVRVWAVRKGE